MFGSLADYAQSIVSIQINTKQPEREAGSMPALGQKQTCAVRNAKSALPPKAGI